MFPKNIIAGGGAENPNSLKSVPPEKSFLALLSRRCGVPDRALISLRSIHGHIRYAASRMTQCEKPEKVLLAPPMLTALH